MAVATRFVSNADVFIYELPQALQLQERGVYVSREYHYEGTFKDGRNDGFGRMTSKCGET